MLKQTVGLRPQVFPQCRYDGSRLLFRGPRRVLDGEFVACLGGTETFGKYVSHPFPDILEEITGVTCVNFGWPNAGIDVFANDRALLDCAGRAQACILQVPCAVNMSNMYYRVHPRRNDRFLQATEALRSLFAEVDYTEFSFTRHLLHHLQDVSADRFSYIRQELALVWVEGMRGLIARIGSPVVLLWLSVRHPDEAVDRPDIWADPALVSREMLEALRGEVLDIVELPPGPARGEVLEPEDHRRAADVLVPVMAEVLNT